MKSQVSGFRARDREMGPGGPAPPRRAGVALSPRDDVPVYFLQGLQPFQW